MASIIGSGINGNLPDSFRPVWTVVEMASIIGSGINGNLSSPSESRSSSPI